MQQPQQQQQRVLFLTFTRQGVNAIQKKLQSLPKTKTLEACETSIGYKFNDQQGGFVRDCLESTSHLTTRACAGSGKTSAVVTATHLLARRLRGGGDNSGGDENKEEEEPQRFRDLETDNPCVRTFHSFCGSLLERGEVKTSIAAWQQNKSEEREREKEMEREREAAASRDGGGEEEGEGGAGGDVNWEEWSVNQFARSVQHAKVWLGEKAENPDTEKEHRLHRDILIIDEVQDTSSSQWELVKLLQRWWGCRLIIIGDINQNIFTYAGADPKAFANPAQHYPDREWLPHQFSNNYRSTPEICRFLTRVLDYNFELTNEGAPESEKMVLHSSRPESACPVKIHGYDRFQAPAKIAKLLQQIVGRGRRTWILCRTNSMCSQWQSYILDELKDLGDEFIVHHQLSNDQMICIDTAHKSKGGEQDAVIVIGVDDAYFPLQSGSGSHLGDECNTLYVACSRAKSELHLVSVDGTYGTLSRFLPPSLVTDGLVQIVTDERTDLRWYSDFVGEHEQKQTDQANLPDHLFGFSLLRLTKSDMLQDVCRQCHVGVEKRNLVDLGSAGGDGEGGPDEQQHLWWPIAEDAAADEAALDRQQPSGGTDDNCPAGVDFFNEDEDEGDSDCGIDYEAMYASGNEDDGNDDGAILSAGSKKLLAIQQQQKRAEDEQRVNQQLALVQHQSLHSGMVEKMSQWQLAQLTSASFQCSAVERLALLPYIPRKVADDVRSLKSPGLDDLLAAMRIRHKSKARDFEANVQRICAQMKWTQDEWEEHCLERWHELWRSYVDYADNFRYGMEQLHGSELRKSLHCLYSRPEGSADPRYSRPEGSADPRYSTKEMPDSEENIRDTVQALLWVAMLDQRYTGLCLSLCYRRELLDMDALVTKYARMWPRVLGYVRHCVRPEEQQEEEQGEGGLCRVMQPVPVTVCLPGGTRHTFRIKGTSDLCLEGGYLSVNIKAATEYQDSFLLDGLLYAALRASQPAAGAGAVRQRKMTSAEVWCPLSNSLYRVNLRSEYATLLLRLLIQDYIGTRLRIKVGLDAIQVEGVALPENGTEKRKQAEKRQRIDSFFPEASGVVPTPPPSSSLPTKKQKTLASWFSSSS